MSDAIAELVMTESSTLEIERQARAEGVRAMRQSGLDKVAAGITTLEEVERVTTD
jgi:type II secretory ATPase GspE/PulE/Tfp pilus assembly ATPase PilB-like protein